MQKIWRSYLQARKDKELKKQICVSPKAFKYTAAYAPCPFTIDVLGAVQTLP